MFCAYATVSLEITCLWDAGTLRTPGGEFLGVCNCATTTQHPSGLQLRAT